MNITAQEGGQGHFACIIPFPMLTLISDKSCCSSITKSYPTLCDLMDYSTPGLHVLHYLLEFAQTHVH